MDAEQLERRLSIFPRARLLIIAGKNLDPDPLRTSVSWTTSRQTIGSSACSSVVILDGNMSDNNILITGTPRSGTTLTCQLLNKLPDTVALHEPMKVKRFAELTSHDEICRSIKRFLRRAADVDP